MKSFVRLNPFSAHDTDQINYGLMFERFPQSPVVNSITAKLKPEIPVRIGRIR
jgi:hypothetical protein